MGERAGTGTQDRKEETGNKAGRRRPRGERGSGDDPEARKRAIGSVQTSTWGRTSERTANQKQEGRETKKGRKDRNDREEEAASTQGRGEEREVRG